MDDDILAEEISKLSPKVERSYREFFAKRMDNARHASPDERSRHREYALSQLGEEASLPINGTDL